MQRRLAFFILKLSLRLLILTIAAPVWAVTALLSLKGIK